MDLTCPSSVRNNHQLWSQ